MPAITFFNEGINYNLKNKRAIRNWLKNTIITEGYQLESLNYILCTDEYLLQINLQYLDHDTYTDIITFDNADKKGFITGDIFISVERIKENAARFAVTPTHELHRVMIHGALHLLGYKDKTTTDKKKMTLKEDHYLSERGF